MEKKKGREWGYASYDVDDENNEKLTYTSYERSGRVNRYTDNGDGGHSHSTWSNKDDYNSGKDSDWSRKESNNSPNPSTGEVQNNGGCYLTTACMKHFQKNFDDNCEELTILRWFRDNFVNKEDIKHYYDNAPIIVETIENINNNEQIYNYIYTHIVVACVNAIKNGDYEFAYNRYKNSIITLEEELTRPILNQRIAKTLKKTLVKN